MDFLIYMGYVAARFFVAWWFWLSSLGIPSITPPVILTVPPLPPQGVLMGTMVPVPEDKALLITVQPITPTQEPLHVDRLSFFFPEHLPLSSAALLVYGVDNLDGTTSWATLASRCSWESKSSALGIALVCIYPHMLQGGMVGLRVETPVLPATPLTALRARAFAQPTPTTLRYVGEGVVTVAGTSSLPESFVTVPMCSPLDPTVAAATSKTWCVQTLNALVKSLGVYKKEAVREEEAKQSDDIYVCKDYAFDTYKPLRAAANPLKRYQSPGFSYYLRRPPEESHGFNSMLCDKRLYCIEPQGIYNEAGVLQGFVMDACPQGTRHVSDPEGVELFYKLQQAEFRGDTIELALYKKLWAAFTKAHSLPNDFE